MVIRLLRHGALFAGAKASVLVAPLLAAAVLGVEGYGAAEWWMALSTVTGPVVGLGANAIVAYGSIGGPMRRHLRTAAMFVILVCGCLVATAAVTALLDLKWREVPLAPAFLQCAVVCLQLTLAARLKGLGFGAWASLVESSLYVGLLIAVVASWGGLDFVRVYLAAMLVISAGLGAGLLWLVPMPRLSTWSGRNYKSFLAQGRQFVAGGALMGGFLASPRALLGIIGTTADVARFALIFRWLSIAVVAHQFISTVFFRQLFAVERAGEGDKAFATTVVLVGLMTALLIMLISSGLLGTVPHPEAEDRHALWAVAAAMVLWSASACQEGALYRIGRPSAQLASVAMGLFVASVSAAILFLMKRDSVLVFSIAWVIGFATIVFRQAHYLKLAGTRLPSIRTAAVSLTLAFLAAGLAHGALV